MKNFVDNFLANIGWNWISQMFRTFGLVLDVFVPRKSRRKNHSCFTFIRYGKKMVKLSKTFIAERVLCQWQKNSGENWS